MILTLNSLYLSAAANITVFWHFLFVFAMYVSYFTHPTALSLVFNILHILSSTPAHR